MLTDLLAVVQYKLQRPLHKRGQESADLQRCWELLKLTSRSFAAVIEQLHPALRDATMIFYLILRGLDTVEDDMGLDNNVKLPLLRNFHEKLKTKDWTFTKSSETEKDRVVLHEFNVILREYHKLKPINQDIIADITKKMGNGMADYIQLENQTNYDGVKTIKDYDLYCHHVAGIVGEGCTRMAIAAGFATSVLKQNPQLYESMGLFLQKTNIIRDYREDQDDGRSFWPSEVWSKYTSKLSSFIDPKNREKGLECVSELTILSLNHVVELLEYLENITDPSYFRFCAIPQVMSIATLELVFQNPEIFDKNVKIRKGLACMLILQSNNMHSVYDTFRHYVRRIHARNNPKDPNFLAIEIKCGEIEKFINSHDKESPEFWSLQRSLRGPRDSDDIGEAAIVLGVGLLAVTFCGAVMVGIASYLGAEFPGWDVFKDEVSRFVDFFFLNKPDRLPMDLQASADAAKASAASLAAAGTAVVKDAASSVHAEL